VLAASIIIIITTATLMMVAASTSETSVNFYQTTQHNIPENSHLSNEFTSNIKPSVLAVYNIQQFVTVTRSCTCN
jgi:hypothetical protein